MVDLKILTESKKIIKELFNELNEKYPELWEKREIKEGTFLYETNKPIKKIFYCEAGISRVFIVDYEMNKEITNGFFTQNEIIVPLFALTKNTPVFANFQVIEDSLMQEITIENWKKIEKEEPNLVSKILFETAIIMAIRLSQFQKYNSLYCNQFRHKILLQDHPFLNRVKKKFITSFLGFDPTTLSRNLSKPLKKRKK